MKNQKARWFNYQCQVEKDLIANQQRRRRRRRRPSLSLSIIFIIITRCNFGLIANANIALFIGLRTFLSKSAMTPTLQIISVFPLHKYLSQNLYILQ